MKRNFGMLHMIGPLLALISLGASVVAGVFANGNPTPIWGMLAVLSMVPFPLLLASRLSADNKPPSVTIAVASGVLIAVFNAAIAASCLVAKHGGPIGITLVIGIALAIACFVLWDEKAFNSVTEGKGTSTQSDSW